MRMPDRRRHRCVLLDTAGRIVDFEEKPDRPQLNVASFAVYVLTPATQDLLDHHRVRLPHRGQRRRRPSPTPRRSGRSRRCRTAPGQRIGRFRNTPR